MNSHFKKIYAPEFDAVNFNFLHIPNDGKKIPVAMKEYVVAQFLSTGYNTSAVIRSAAMIGIKKTATRTILNEIQEPVPIFGTNTYSNVRIELINRILHCKKDAEKNGSTHLQPRCVIKIDGVNIRPGLSYDSFSKRLIGFCDTEGTLLNMLDDPGLSFDKLLIGNEVFDEILQKKIKSKSHAIMVQFTNLDCVTNYPLMIGCDNQCKNTKDEDFLLMIKLVEEVLDFVGMQIVSIISDCEPKTVILLRSFDLKVLWDVFHVFKSMIYGMSRNTKLIFIGKQLIGLDKIHDRSTISLSRIDKEENQKNNKTSKSQQKIK